jgi:hypothetical protein
MRIVGGFVAIDQEVVAPRQPGIPKRKKSDITRLSCKIDYLLRSNHNDQSIASEFFTGD